MHTLRRLRSIGRFTAAWFLLWACLMAAAPIPALPEGGHAAVPAAAGGAGTDIDAQHQSPECDHADGEPHAGHQGHGSESAHCPVCLQAAAPPPPPVEPDLTGRRPADVPVAAHGMVLRVHAAMPPPARGPPVFS